ncbi:MAG: glycosyltransferase family 4 protein [Holosporales bacterium]|jgi:glycosyltransferase involved in cell wall biosynthesis
MHIAFVHDAIAPYFPEQLYTGGLRGIETSVLLLAKEFSKKGHTVTIYNGAPVQSRNGLYFSPLPTKATRIDTAILINDHRLIDRLNSNVRLIMWLHNPTPLPKAIRTGRLWRAWYYRPHTVVSSQWHAQWQARRGLFSGGVSVIPLGIADIFQPVNNILPGSSIGWTTQRYRGFKEFLPLWKRLRSRVPDARLCALLKPEEGDSALEKDGIFIAPPLSWPHLPAWLAQHRAIVFPWQKPETFCLAAGEAIACGTPVVARNIGALTERVTHKATGFLANNNNDLEKALEQLLCTDTPFGLVPLPQPNRWDAVAEKWLKLLHSNN